MTAMPNRRSPRNPITQTLDRLIEAERAERAARTARRKALAGGVTLADEAHTPLPPTWEPSPL